MYNPLISDLAFVFLESALILQHPGLDVVLPMKLTFKFYLSIDAFRERVGYWRNRMRGHFNGASEKLCMKNIKMLSVKHS